MESIPFPYGGVKHKYRRALLLVRTGVYFQAGGRRRSFASVDLMSLSKGGPTVRRVIRRKKMQTWADYLDGLKAGALLLSLKTAKEYQDIMQHIWPPQSSLTLLLIIFPSWRTHIFMILPLIHSSLTVRESG